MNPGQASLGKLYIFDPLTKSKHCITLAYRPHQASLCERLSLLRFCTVSAPRLESKLLFNQAKLGRGHSVSLNCPGLFLMQRTLGSSANPQSSSCLTASFPLWQFVQGHASTLNSPLSFIFVANKMPFFVTSFHFHKIRSL